MTTTAPAHLRTLVDRCTWLEVRIAEARVQTRDRLEAKALRWALPILGDVVARGADEGRDVEKAQRQQAWAWVAQSALEALGRRDPAAAAGIINGCRHPGVRAQLIAEVSRRIGPPRAQESADV